MADKKGVLRGLVRKAGAGIMKGANKVTDLTGARDLSNYAAGKMAKMMVPKDARKYVKDDTSGKAALKSAGKLGLSVASVASVAGAARGAGAIAARSAAKKAGKTTTNRILASHKAGGDAKMLKALKDSNPRVGRKLGVRSSKLDEATGKFEKTPVGSTSRFNVDKAKWEHVPDKIKMTSKRSILKDKLHKSRDNITRLKELSKRERGDSATKYKQKNALSEYLREEADAVKYNRMSKSQEKLWDDAMRRVRRGEDIGW